MAELRTALKHESDPEARFRLGRRIAELTPMLTDCNAISYCLTHYYDKGGNEHDERFGFNGVRRPKKRPVETHRRRRSSGIDDRATEADIHNVSLSDDVDHRHRTRIRCIQEYDIPHIDTCREEIGSTQENIVEDLISGQIDIGGRHFGRMSLEL